jgi:hypothetical protein
MKNPAELTREDVKAAACSIFSSKRTKWTVDMEGKEFPVRPVQVK